MRSLEPYPRMAAMVAKASRRYLPPATTTMPRPLNSSAGYAGMDSM